MVKVLFVCLGNICRSPMAEAIFHDLVTKKGLEEKFVIDSAGTGDYHIGEPPHEGTVEKLSEYDISTNGMVGRQVSEEDFLHFDYLIAMDDDNLSELKKLASGESEPAIKKLLDYMPEHPTRNVPDPYFTGDFDETYELLSEACKLLLDEIRRIEEV
ncbi:low molecular weight phosphotyrosine protein phosphatase [Halalkalibacillus sediminis]|uniref:protein-tyrosine-phosphatase n=1 Tax=Halalkalibacillus sediminis TaxID=2018042 RepID=A0A2I0QRG9_9BACI|nr:low molecular weight protein-tyrosine-phosphatase [Halalkalibacillus sediminis]PKR76928.1 low molecular weight phosphotyrosine protein phosphatase [Halalkalibacillus sediminis]